MVKDYIELFISAATFILGMILFPLLRFFKERREAKRGVNPIKIVEKTTFFKVVAIRDENVDQPSYSRGARDSNKVEIFDEVIATSTT